MRYFTYVIFFNLRYQAPYHSAKPFLCLEYFFIWINVKDRQAL